MSMEAFGKLLGIEIKPVQEEPQWIPETPDQLRAITALPTIPQHVWDVAGGGLNDQELALTNNNITATAKLMRARLLHIRTAFNQLNLPMTYATYTIEDWITSPKRAAERSLLQRFIRSQSGPRNWGTPQNKLPIDFDWNRDVALARGHVHSGTMWEALKAQAPPPPGPSVFGYVLPLTPQERAVSVEMKETNWAERRLPLAQRQKALRGELPQALYPHLATPQKPGLSHTYNNMLLYVREQIDNIRSSGADMKGPVESILAARAVMNEWNDFFNTLHPKWNIEVLVPRDQEAQRSMGGSPYDKWLRTHQDQLAAWIASHPEVKSELAHAKTLIMPNQRWLNWISGKPYSTSYADGTRLEYLVAIYDPATHGASAPMTTAAACVGARAQRVTKAQQTGSGATYSSPKPC